MVSEDQVHFISILSDYLAQKKSDVLDNTDLSLLSYAKQQELQAVVYYQTKIPSLKSAYASTVLRSVTRKKFLSQIHDAFREAKIPYFLVKGVEAAQFYPHPELRTMGDCDILVHQEDMERSHSALLRSGFDCYSQGPHDRHYRKNGLIFEVHRALLHEETILVERQKIWTDQVWEHVSTEDGIFHHLEIEYHLVFLLIHLRRHLLSYGVGFRQFMDLAVISKQNIDWKKVEGYLLEIDLLPFAKICFAMCERWFHVSIPIVEPISDDFYEDVTGKVFDGGVFGFLDDGNRGNRAVNLFNRNNRIAVVAKIIFPDYEYFYKIEEYSFIKNKPFLLPIAWGYRFRRAIRIGQVKDVFKSSFVLLFKRRIQEREDYLRKWGLL